MQPAPSLDDQIAYAEAELERSLALAPALIRSGVRSAPEVDRELELQTAIVASLKRQARAVATIPVDLRDACDRLSAEITRVRASVEGDACRRAAAA